MALLPLPRCCPLPQPPDLSQLLLCSPRGLFPGPSQSQGTFFTLALLQTVSYQTLQSLSTGQSHYKFPP